MHAPEYRSSSRVTAMAFLDACTSTPATEDSVFSAGKVSTLLEYAVRSGDLRPLESAFIESDYSVETFFDLFACAIHTLADSISDQPVASITALVHRCADIQDDLIRNYPERVRPAALAVAI